jgi:hypothetical protein
VSRLENKSSLRRIAVTKRNLARNNRVHARGISRNLFASAATERRLHAAQCTAAHAWCCGDMRGAADSTAARSAILALAEAICAWRV